MGLIFAMSQIGKSNVLGLYCAVSFGCSGNIRKCGASVCAYSFLPIAVIL